MFGDSGELLFGVCRVKFTEWKLSDLSELEIEVSWESIIIDYELF